MTPEEKRELDRILREGIDPERARLNILRRQEYEAQGKGREDYRFQVHTIPPDFFEDAARIQANIQAGVYGPHAKHDAGERSNSPIRKGWLSGLLPIRGSARRQQIGAVTGVERLLERSSLWLVRTSRRAILLGTTAAVAFAAMCAAIAFMIQYYPDKIGAGYFVPPGTQMSPPRRAELNSSSSVPPENRNLGVTNTDTAPPATPVPSSSAPTGRQNRSSKPKRITAATSKESLPHNSSTDMDSAAWRDF